MTTAVNMSLAEVMSTQQLMQYVQISRDRAQAVLTQFTRENAHQDAQVRLQLAITQLKLVEADLCDTLGFTSAADKLRGSM